MMRFAILTVVLFAAAAPAAAQIVTPVLTPTCVTKHCPGAPHTTTTQSHVCPPGTVYMPQKGTCKVLPPSPGN